MLTPIMFFLIFGAVQFALYSFAADVAKAAAQAGAREARREADVSAGWQDSARSKAHDYVRQLAGPGLLANVSVPVGREGDMVSVTVIGDAPAILPGMTLQVRAVSEGPVERFVPDGG
ncbi:TadE/TadG family type IV pilus assembly protein [Streptomyces spiramenti]|nr:TadE/TadG family type IV pilus assembly protein [Streptomyces spiramenti]